MWKITLTQLVSEPARECALLDLFVSREELVGDVMDGWRLTWS